MYGFGSAVFLVWHLACLAGALGVLFLIFWVYKTLKGPQLLKLSITLIAISLLGGILGSFFLSRGGWDKDLKSRQFGPGMMWRGAWDLQEKSNDAQ